MKEINTFWLRDGRRFPVKKGSDNLGLGAPVTLVAWEQTGPETLKYATATHTPPDVFSRKNAHDKANGRLAGEEVTITVIDPQLGPEATIAKDILRCRRGDQRLPPPRIFVAAAASLPDLIERHTRYEEKKNKAAAK